MRIGTDYDALAGLLVSHGITADGLEQRGYQLYQVATWAQVWSHKERLAHLLAQASEREAALAEVLPRYVCNVMAASPHSLLMEALRIKSQIRREVSNSLTYQLLIQRAKNVAALVEKMSACETCMKARLALETVEKRTGATL